MDQSDLGYLLALVRVPLLGPKRLALLRQFFPNCQAAFAASTAEWEAVGLPASAIQAFVEKRPTLDPERELSRLEQEEVTAVSLDDPGYPPLLKELYDPPAVLFVRGILPPASAAWLAVVGTRKPSPYGQRVTRNFVSALASSGVVTVSGLAYGIDAIAHAEACRAGGPTVAVLGSGVDRASIYPVGNQPLAEDILRHGGAIVSEFPIGTEVQKHHFPIRNRVIAGLCHGTLVVEAGQKSGALITARAALEAGRDVFAVPGPIDAPNSVGPNNLIRMGAQVAACPDDILSALGIARREPSETSPPPPNSPIEAQIVALLSSRPLHVDDITRASGLPTPAVTSALTLMEMKGTVRHLGGMQYVRG
ncbi:DNA-protecting protein DprA [Candidatus Uhrbacteria bacterium]|nr:DNA-protecting protein DprA [Candidatus Uhrbacteria bacterium]